MSIKSSATCCCVLADLLAVAVFGFAFVALGLVALVALVAFAFDAVGCLSSVFLLVLDTVLFLLLVVCL